MQGVLADELTYHSDNYFFFFFNHLKQNQNGEEPFHVMNSKRLFRITRTHRTCNAHGTCNTHSYRVARGRDRVLDLSLLQLYVRNSMMLQYCQSIHCCSWLFNKKNNKNRNVAVRIRMGISRRCSHTNPLSSTENVDELIYVGRQINLTCVESYRVSVNIV